MGFQIVNIPSPSAAIDINSLSPDMISDLMICYANNVDPVDFEARYNLPKNLLLNYPIINRTVVSEFYSELDSFVKGLIAVIQGNFYVSGATMGSQPTCMTDVQNNMNLIIQRDFYLHNTWLYSYSQGDFSALEPFILNGINMFFAANGGDFNTVCSAVLAAYPPSDSEIY
jgi:hypothetical protein